MLGEGLLHELLEDGELHELGDGELQELGDGLLGEGELQELLGEGLLGELLHPHELPEDELPRELLPLDDDPPPLRHSLVTINPSNKKINNFLI